MIIEDNNIDLKEIYNKSISSTKNNNIDLEEIYNDTIKEYNKIGRVNIGALTNRYKQFTLGAINNINSKYNFDTVNTYALIMGFLLNVLDVASLQSALNQSRYEIINWFHKYRWIPEELRVLKSDSATVFVIVKQLLSYDDGIDLLNEEQTYSILQRIRNTYKTLDSMDYKYNYKEDIMVIAEQELSESIIDINTIKIISDNKPMYDIKKLSIRLEQYVKNIIKKRQPESYEMHLLEKLQLQGSLT